jgi:hypothetical protein
MPPAFDSKPEAMLSIVPIMQPAMPPASTPPVGLFPVMLPVKELPFMPPAELADILPAMPPMVR